VVLTRLLLICNIIVAFLLFSFVLPELIVAKLPLVLNNARSKVHKVFVHKCFCYFSSVTCFVRYAVEQLVEALRYNSEGRGFGSRWCHWNFSLT
jgi:hypothetical protein